MTRRPLIGVTCNVEPAAWGDWRAEACVLASSYPRAVLAAGGDPVLLPTGLCAPTDAAVAALDGLVVAGGPDVDPGLYGQRPHARTSARPRRDRHELALLAAAERRRLPTLAICRGLQLLNVARGGTLVQHLPDVVGHDEHLPARGAFATHRVAIDVGSRLGAALGAHARAASYHHQGIADVGADLRAVAWAPDGTVEALEDSARPWCVGVLWHPEEGDDPALFAALVEAARDEPHVGAAP